MRTDFVAGLSIGIGLGMLIAFYIEWGKQEIERKKKEAQDGERD